MRYSNATNYALHTIVHLMLQPRESLVGVQELAEMQRLSPTYLSKILTKLTKAGLIQSTPGAKGGYKISTTKHEISFLDVIHAIEGDTSLFECTIHHEGCLIESTMRKAEKNMKSELESMLLNDIADEAKAKQKKS
ncbi:RrF2 family transcriptional regulator [Oceanobacillus alkalisoli]|uniref:RrF2 family transcriptional regulator n=1 Tax=Oceanobacillus alkalisoli TaxID=2925113 RepID=UPI001EF129A1|nr:Rrf2 family transcriptional regulator [Oceanobacillus alkalisoli]MCF3942649.1 Rrf2 family transcriptional regulator [Oceanobacillus alkalisoli]MCG5102629.1 Rrf2 family transcriptional regulator [Oceanobacillus alkalisoli]